MLVTIKEHDAVLGQIANDWLNDLYENKREVFDRLVEDGVLVKEQTSEPPAPSEHPQGASPIFLGDKSPEIL